MSLERPKKKIEIDRLAFAKDLDDIARILEIDLSKAEEEDENQGKISFKKRTVRTKNASNKKKKLNRK